MKVRVKNTDKAGRTLFIRRRIDHGKEYDVEYTPSVKKMIEDGTLALLTPHEEPIDSVSAELAEPKELVVVPVQELKASEPEVVEPVEVPVVEIVEPEIEVVEPEAEATPEVETEPEAEEGSIKQRRRRKNK